MIDRVSVDTQSAAPAFMALGSIPVGDVLGEGIVWDHRLNAFLWTDIMGKRLSRLDWPSRSVSHFALPHRLGSFALTENEAVIVAAFDRGIARYDYHSGALDWVVRPELPDGVRFNDGRCDRNGRFVVGTMVEDAEAAGGSDTAKLYRLEEDGSLTALLDSIAISNALCWSPDGNQMYHADSPTGQLKVYDYAKPGEAGRVLQTYADGSVPDGACVDCDRRVWVAAWGGGAVVVHDAQGFVLGRIPVPAKQPTCTALGGEDMDILAVTSASIGLGSEASEGDGGLHLFRVEGRGLREVVASYR